MKDLDWYILEIALRGSVTLTTPKGLNTISHGLLPMDEYELQHATLKGVEYYSPKIFI